MPPKNITKLEKEIRKDVNDKIMEIKLEIGNILHEKVNQVKQEIVNDITTKVVNDVKLEIGNILKDILVNNGNNGNRKREREQYDPEIDENIVNFGNQEIPQQQEEVNIGNIEIGYQGNLVNIIHENVNMERENNNNYNNNVPPKQVNLEMDKKQLERKVDMEIIKRQITNYPICKKCKKHMIPMFQEKSKFVNGIDFSNSAWKYCGNDDCITYRKSLEILEKERKKGNILTPKREIQYYFNPREIPEQVNMKRETCLVNYLERDDVVKNRTVEWKYIYRWLFYLMRGNCKLNKLEIFSKYYKDLFQQILHEWKVPITFEEIFGNTM